MTLKKFLFVMMAFVAVGMFIMIYYPDYLFGFMGIMFMAAIIAELGRLFSHYQKSKQLPAKSLKTDRFKEDESNEYHNDFSKVPGGVDEPGVLPPMPRGIIIGDPYRTFEENLKADLERIGLVDEKEDQEEDDKDKK